MQRVERELEPRPETRPVLFITRSRGDHDVAARRLASYIADLGFSRPHLVASSRALDLLAELRPVQTNVVPTLATATEARACAKRARAKGADVVIGSGGGFSLDFAKAAATAADLPMVAIPTQLSHDGFASPVSILTDGRGRRVTLEVRTPEAVFLSLPTVAQAPKQAFVAGLGDLLSNRLALLDWELAERRGNDIVIPSARALARESVELIDPLLHSDPERTCKDPQRLALLATALVNSGRAMFIAGSSRPASGAEHKISHAIDAVLRPRALHGAQVAFGCVISSHLHGADTSEILQILTNLGLPTHPGDLRLTRAELRDVLDHAMTLRPERYTILDELPRYHGAVDDLISDLWPDV